MDEQNNEVLKRLEDIERELSDIRCRLEAIESGASSGVSEKKNTKRRLALFICIPILILCLAVGGILAVRAITATPGSGSDAVTAETDVFANAKIGDTIAFGKYNQNGSEADGPEPIEWIVLDKQDGKLLLLSRYILFEGKSAGKEWIINDLRKSLNAEFHSAAFLPEEQNRICETPIVSSYHATPIYDKIFLLSEEEVEKYLPTDDSRNCGFQYSTKDGGSWWLRSCYEVETEQKRILRRQIVVTQTGSFDFHTFNTSSATISSGIRPAMWVEIEP